MSGRGEPTLMEKLSEVLLHLFQPKLFATLASRERIPRTPIKYTTPRSTLQLNIANWEHIIKGNSY